MTNELPSTRAHTVAALATEESEAIHRRGRLTDPVLRALIETNMFRVTAPQVVGGDEIDVATFADILGTVGRADLSTGWCIVQANASSRSFGSRLDPTVAQELLAAPDTAIAAGFPTGECRADKVEGGYIVSGRWGFASGCLHCNWFDGRAVVHIDGQPVKTETGFGFLASNLVPADRVTILETWDVSGLRGTGSHSYLIDEVFVPEELSLPLFAPEPPELSPALRVPLLTYAHIGFAAMGLGAAWAALDDFIDLVGGKTPGLSRTPMRETATAHRTIGEVRSRLQGASAHLAWITDRLVNEAEVGSLSTEAKVDSRLAIMAIVDAAVAAVELLYRVSGTTGIFTSSPLQRRFQDIHVLSQQVFARPAHYENVGRVLLGLEHEANLL